MNTQQQNPDPYHSNQMRNQQNFQDTKPSPISNINERYKYYEQNLDSYSVNNMYYSQMPPQMLNSQQQKINNNQIFKNIPGVYIKQQVQQLENYLGCETENSFKVFQTDINGQRIGTLQFIYLKDGQQLFKIKEKSDCCARLCLSGSCRPYHLKLTGLDLDLEAKRDFKIPCLCFFRPEMEVYKEIGPNHYLIGKIINEFDCCNIRFLIQQKGKKPMIIKGDIFQLGNLCRQFPCKQCQDASFEILDQKGKEIGHMNKHSSGFCKACFGNVDNFWVVFPQNTDDDDKSMIMMASAFIDYMYFEDNSLIETKSSNFNLAQDQNAVHHIKLPYLPSLPSFSF